jgi:hypothetical protein
MQLQLALPHSLIAADQRAHNCHGSLTPSALPTRFLLSTCRCRLLVILQPTWVSGAQGCGFPGTLAVAPTQPTTACACRLLTVTARPRRACSFHPCSLLPPHPPSLSLPPHPARCRQCGHPPVLHRPEGGLGRLLHHTAGRLLRCHGAALHRRQRAQLPAAPCARGRPRQAGHRLNWAGINGLPCSRPSRRGFAEPPPSVDGAKLSRAVSQAYWWRLAASNTAQGLVVCSWCSQRSQWFRACKSEAEGLGCAGTCAWHKQSCGELRVRQALHKRLPVQGAWPIAAGAALMNPAGGRQTAYASGPPDCRHVTAPIFLVAVAACSCHPCTTLWCIAGGSELMGERSGAFECPGWQLVKRNAYGVLQD